MKLLLAVTLSTALASAKPVMRRSLPMHLERRQDDTCGPVYSEWMLWNFNLHRANHSVVDLVWNDTLAEAAQATTEKPDLEHDNDGTGWGQNLYNWYDSDPTYKTLGVGAIDSWYNHEFRNWDKYGDASKLDLANDPNIWPAPAVPDGDYGHFTQIIWRDTLMVGCATAEKTASDGLPGGWTVCNFYPPGNSISNDYSWVDNVLPPLEHDVVNYECVPTAD